MGPNQNLSFISPDDKSTNKVHALSSSQTSCFPHLHKQTQQSLVSCFLYNRMYFHKEEKQNSKGINLSNMRIKSLLTNACTFNSRNPSLRIIGVFISTICTLRLVLMVFQWIILLRINVRTTSRIGIKSSQHAQIRLRHS